MYIYSDKLINRDDSLNKTYSTRKPSSLGRVYIIQTARIFNLPEIRAVRAITARVDAPDGSAFRFLRGLGLGAWPLPARASARGVDGVDRIGEPRLPWAHPR
jgi:hypothetical protein